MRSEEEIREKFHEMQEKATGAAIDSHRDRSMKAVNRGACYGWAEALSWVLGDRCDWTCPECGQLCGGIEDHQGAHECVNDACPKSGVKRTDLQDEDDSDE